MMRALRMKDVVAKVGLDESTLRSMIEADTFPRPAELVPNRTVRLESDLDAWLAGNAGVVQTRPDAPTTNDDQRIDELVRKIASRRTPYDLRDLVEVAEYLRRSKQYTRQWITTQDGPPRLIRIPSGKSATE